MKKYCIIFVLLLLGCVTFAQTGVNFEELSFQEALAKAQKEGKLVFVDFHATWCSPCKGMANEVLPLEEVGNAVNPTCVSIKIDVDDKDGKEISKKYGVSMLPSFVIICPDGTMQHKLVGFIPAEVFVSKLNRAFDRRLSWGNLREKYLQDSLNVQEQMCYLVALQDCLTKEGNIKKEWDRFSKKWSKKDRFTPEYWELIRDVDCMNVNFRFVLEHLKDFEKVIGREEVMKRIEAKYVDKALHLSSAYQLKEKEQREKALQLSGQMMRDVKRLEFGRKPRVVENLTFIQNSLKEDMSDMIAYILSAKLEKDTDWLVKAAYWVVLRCGEEKDWDKLLASRDKLLQMGDEEHQKFVAKLMGYLQEAKETGYIN